MGQSRGGSPWLEITRRNGEAVAVGDGAASADGRVWGCYLHGLFGTAGLRRAWLNSLGHRPGEPAVAEDSFDRLADAVEAALDMARLETIIRESV
jgi:adenosylcobyric acid synthase